VIREFFVDLAWGIPVFIGAVIMFGTWIVRRTMAPLRTVAEAAAGISPKNPAVRLPTTNVPSEVIPVVVATNAALARLQEAYVQQQRFIANAAHELRTPVAVFRAGLERLPPSSERIALLADVERLARLTAQLLDLARAERAGDEGTSDAVAVTRDVAAQLAPLAAGRGVTLAIEGGRRDAGARRCRACDTDPAQSRRERDPPCARGVRGRDRIQREFAAHLRCGRRARRSP
jgi:signal transduction histidine kinase